MRMLSCLADFLYPPRCPLCQSYVRNAGGWCGACLEKTARPHSIALPPEEHAVFCRIWALGRYHGVLRSLIIKLKYKKKMSVLPGIHRFVEHAAAELVFPENIDVVICVPLHEKRRHERGFNQTELIFEKWLSQNGFESGDFLKRNHFTEPQYNLAKAERFKNLKDAFMLKENCNIKGRNCLLLDDVFTTGATMAACARLLKQNGAAKIYGLVLSSDAYM